MAVTALELDRGTYHGRIPASDAPAGTYVFELGHTHRIAERFNDGDKIELTQSLTAKFASTKLIRCTVKLKAPTVAVAGAYWTFTVELGAVTFYSRRIDADGRELTINNIGVSLAALNPGTATLKFALTLTAV